MLSVADNDLVAVTIGNHNEFNRSFGTSSLPSRTAPSPSRPLSPEAPSFRESCELEAVSKSSTFIDLNHPKSPTFFPSDTSNPLFQPKIIPEPEEAVLGNIAREVKSQPAEESGETLPLSLVANTNGTSSRPVTGRKKIKIERIEQSGNRQATFNKRKVGLVKKAIELSILCECEIAMLVFAKNGKMISYSSSETEQLIEKYHNYEGYYQSISNDNLNDLRSGSSSASRTSSRKRKIRSVTTDQSNSSWQSNLNQRTYLPEMFDEYPQQTHYLQLLHQFGHSSSAMRNPLVGQVTHNSVMPTSVVGRTGARILKTSESQTATRHMPDFSHDQILSTTKTRAREFDDHSSGFEVHNQISTDQLHAQNHALRVRKQLELGQYSLPFLGVDKQPAQAPVPRNFPPSLSGQSHNPHLCPQSIIHPVFEEYPDCNEEAGF